MEFPYILAIYKHDDARKMHTLKSERKKKSSNGSKERKRDVSVPVD